MLSVVYLLLVVFLFGYDLFVEGVEFRSNGKYIMLSLLGKLIFFYDGRDVFFICCVCEVLCV